MQLYIYPAHLLRITSEMMQHKFSVLLEFSLLRMKCGEKRVGKIYIKSLVYFNECDVKILSYSSAFKYFLENIF